VTAFTSLFELSLKIGCFASGAAKASCNCYAMTSDVIAVIFGSCFERLFFIRRIIHD
jgi:hypothetical protein